MKPTSFAPPIPKSDPKKAAAFVRGAEQRILGEEKIVRITIDLPANLHRRLKIKAAEEGTKIAELVRGWVNENCKQ